MSASTFATLCDRLMAITIVFVASALVTFPAAAPAGVRPQVDLSLQVTAAPVPFVPGGHGTVTLTVHNAGPDTAGATLPNDDSIVAYENWFDITTQPPPFFILVQGVGCIVDTFVSEPLPDGRIGLVYIFYFGPIAPGESRVCTYGIDFQRSTRASFTTGWFVTSPNDDDTDPSNDRVDDYVFQAPAAPVASMSVPATSWQGLIALGIGLFAVAGRVCRRKNRSAG